MKKTQSQYFTPVRSPTGSTGTLSRSKSSQKPIRPLRLGDIHKASSVRQRQAKQLYDADLEQLKKIFLRENIVKKKKKKKASSLADLMSSVATKKGIKIPLSKRDPNKILHLRIHCRSLLSLDKFSDADPRVQVKMGGEEIGMTEFFMNEPNPDFKIRFAIDFKPDMHLELCVYDCDRRGILEEETGSIKLAMTDLVKMLNDDLSYREKDRKAQMEKRKASSVFDEDLGSFKYKYKNELRTLFSSDWHETLLKFPLKSRNPKRQRNLTEAGSCIIIVASVQTKQEVNSRVANRLAAKAKKAQKQNKLSLPKKTWPSLKADLDFS